MSETPTDEQISQVVEQILRTNDLQCITLRIVMNMLCERFDLPKEHLSAHKPFVKNYINDFLNNNYRAEAEDAAAAAAAATTNAPEPGASGMSSSAGGGSGGIENGNGAGVVEEEGGGDDGGEEEVVTTKKRKVGRPRGSANTVDKATKAAAVLAKGPKAVKLTGLEKPVVLAQPLADFFGDLVMARSHIPKRISMYAKQHNLQDPTNGRRIVCDAALKEAFSVDDFTFFSLQKLISQLVYKPDECSEELQQLAKQCEEKLIEEKTQRLQEQIANGELNEGAKRPRKKAKRGSKENGNTGTTTPRKTGISKPMQLSAALTAVVGEDQASRSDVMKKVWDYIKANNLKDPSNGRQVMCDDKLKAVFDGLPTIEHLHIMKGISAHMTKIET